MKVEEGKHYRYHVEHERLLHGNVVVMGRELRCKACLFVVDLWELPRFAKNSFRPRLSMGKRLMREHWEKEHSDHADPR